MKEIFIIEENFEEKNLVLNFLKKKNLNAQTISLNEIKKIEKNKSTIICTKNLQEKIGGKSEILKVSRTFGSTNILILEKSEAGYEMQTDLGGAYVIISL